MQTCSSRSRWPSCAIVTCFPFLDDVASWMYLNSHFARDAGTLAFNLLPVPSTITFYFVCATCSVSMGDRPGRLRRRVPVRRRRGCFRRSGSSTAWPALHGRLGRSVDALFNPSPAVPSITFASLRHAVGTQHSDCPDVSGWRRSPQHGPQTVCRSVNAALVTVSSCSRTGTTGRFRAFRAPRWPACRRSRPNAFARARPAGVGLEPALAAPPRRVGSPPEHEPPRPDTGATNQQHFRTA